MTYSKLSFVAPKKYFHGILFLFGLFLILLVLGCEIPFGEKESPKQEPPPRTKASPGESNPKQTERPAFDYIGPYSEDMAPVQKKGKWGFIDPENKLLIPLIFDWVNPFKEGLAAMELDGKWGFVDTKGTVIVPADYEWADNFYQGRAIVQKDGKEGAINRQGKIVIPFVYDYIARFEDSTSIIKNYFRDTLSGQKEAPRLEKWGLIRHSGQELIPPQYQHIESFQRGFARVMQTRKDSQGQYRKVYGMIDQSGKLRVPVHYRFLGKPGIYKRMQACLDSSGLWGYLNPVGEKQSDFIYDLNFAFRENRGRVKKGAFFGFLDTLGYEIIPLEYPYAEDFRGGTAIIAQNGLYGLINLKGQLILPSAYQEIRRVNDFLFHARARKEWLSFLCNQQGELLLKPGEFDSLFVQSPPLISVSDWDGNRFGYYDQKAEAMLVPVVYDRILPFQRGVALVAKSQMWGAYKQDGAMAIPIEYQNLRFRAQDGVLLAQYQNQWSFMLIGEQGEILVPFGKYEKIFDFKEGKARVYRKGLYGFINTKGEEVTPLVYNDAQDFAQGKANIRVKNRLGYLDARGKEHWEKE